MDWSNIKGAVKMKGSSNSAPSAKLKKLAEDGANKELYSWPKEPNTGDDEKDAAIRKIDSERLQRSVPGIDPEGELHKAFPSNLDQGSANSRINKLYKKWLSMDSETSDPDEMDALMLKIEALKKIRKAEGNDPLDLAEEKIESRKPKHSSAGLTKSR